MKGVFLNLLIYFLFVNYLPSAVATAMVPELIGWATFTSDAVYFTCQNSDFKLARTASLEGNTVLTLI